MQPIKSFHNTRRFITQTTVVVLLFLGFISCRKGNPSPWPGGQDASGYNADVVDKWITMQLRLERDAAGIPNVAFERYYAYSGVAAFEAVAPGTPLSEAAHNKWNGLTGLPHAEAFKTYYWPASVNAALAEMNRSIFSLASAADQSAIDSLEKALDNAYLKREPAEVIGRSRSFGKATAVAVYSWSESDGYKHQSDPYVLPIGTGLWQPTPPPFAPASTPYLGNNRPIVAGSADHAQPGPPTPYSEKPGSAFYKMAKNVYQISHRLSAADSATALYWRDLPGVTTAGHWLSMLQQVLKKTGSPLDRAAYAYAVSGVCQSDASISCWETKYKYNLLRPITYIHAVFGDTAWKSVLTTPAHPDYISAHAVISGAASDAFTALFGNIGDFTDHTYDYLGFQPKTFHNFREIGMDAARSRVLAGIHFQPSVDLGLVQGRTVAANVLQVIGDHGGNSHKY